MRSYLILCLAVAVVAAEGRGYHDFVGVPLAARLKKAEEAAIQGSSRIIGGQPAPLGAHPYLVGLIIHLENGWTSACGSSMLSNTRALTAAHCWYDEWRLALGFTLVFGSEHLFFGGVRVDSSDVHTHSGWDGTLRTLEYDLAIINFNYVAYTNVIQPISLPTNNLESSDFVGVWAQASGYGKIADLIGLQPAQVQSHVTLQVISNNACRSAFGAIVTERIICTSGAGAAGPVGVCSSDSGGPLSVVSNNQRVLIGVVSFGSASCEAGLPSGYVRVTAHLPWIRERL